MVTIRNRRGAGVTLEAVRQAQAAGVGGDTIGRVMGMARRSAPLTHPRGNRRYDDFVFMVDKGVVVAVGRLSGHCS